VILDFRLDIAAHEGQQSKIKNQKSKMTRGDE
jgi:hypothetical protein